MEKKKQIKNTNEKLMIVKKNHEEKGYKKNK